MSAEQPLIGHWYRRGNFKLFEVVALDEKDKTIELQHFDGTIEEMDLENWPAPLLEEAGAPEDWSGAVDIAIEDTVRVEETYKEPQWIDPLAVLERN